MTSRSGYACGTIIMGLVLAVVGWPGSAIAVTLNVPSQYPSLAAALDNAGRGDVISLAPGIYQEHGLTVPSGVTITGTGQIPQDVIIDGARQGRILLLEGLAETVTIKNILFMNGQATGPSNYDSSGGAIYVSNSLVAIENCVFSANVADSHGGAVRMVGSTGTIVSCAFYANSAPNGGGGALDFSYLSSPLVQDCIFLANRASWGGAISCRGGSSPRVEDSELSANMAEGNQGFGGGVFADTHSHPDLLNSLVVENQGYFGGGLASWTDGAINLDYCTVAYNKGWVLEGGMLAVRSSPLVTGSIIAFNSGRGVSVAGGSELQVTCTDMYGNTSGDWAFAQANLAEGSGNLNVDPGFCTIQLGHKNRFALSSSSPLVADAGGCGVLGGRPVACEGDKSLQSPPSVSAAIERVQAAPNPFNPRTTVSFEISRAQDVRVAIYGIDGRLVNVLADENLSAGRHEMAWLGRDRSGRQVSSGTYFVLIKGSQETKRLKVTLLK